MNLLKKAAMFGLDARIALAIFGALSVVSGAALYSAIQNSKVTALLTEYNEIGKAWESYYLDVGSQLPIYGASHNRFLTGGLVTNSAISGWSGPYLSYEEKTSVAFKPLIHPKFYTIIAMYANSTDWSVYSDAGNECATDEDCYLWILIDGLDESLVKEFDLRFDNADGDSKGKLRYDNSSHIDVKWRGLYRYAPIKKPA